MTNKPQSEAPSVDELDLLVTTMMHWQGFYYEAMQNLPEETRQFVDDPKFQKAKQALNLYIEEKMKEARLDELKHIDDPANVRLWFDGYYGVKERIEELEG